MSKNVFVFCEQRDGQIQKVTLELLAAGSVRGGAAADEQQRDEQGHDAADQQRRDHGRGRRTHEA